MRILQRIDLGTRLLLLAVLIAADAALNASRILLLATDNLTYLAWLCVAIGLALAPAVISSYGDKWAITIGFVACFASFALSCWSIVGFVDGKAHASNSAASDIERYEQELVTLNDSARRQIALCSRKPADECDSIKLESQLNNKREAIQQKLDVSKSLQPMDQFDVQLWTALLLVVALTLQILGAELGRQIGSIIRVKEAKKALKVPKNSSLARNSEPLAENREPKSGSSEPLKPVVKAEPLTPKSEPKPEKKSSQSSQAARRRGNQPTDEQRQRLKIAYANLMERGESVTGESLQKESQVRKSVCLNWKKNELPQIVKFKEKGHV